MQKDDPALLWLRRWALWVSEGKPIDFSLLGDSVIGKRVAHERLATRGHRTLWREGPRDFVVTLDNRLQGALSAHERRVLLAACVPLGRTATAAERAAAAGVSRATLLEVLREAAAVSRELLEREESADDAAA